MQKFVFSNLSLQELDIYTMGLSTEQSVMANLPSQQVKMLSKSYTMIAQVFLMLNLSQVLPSQPVKMLSKSYMMNAQIYF